MVVAEVKVPHFVKMESDYFVFSIFFFVSPKMKSINFRKAKRGKKVENKRKSQIRFMTRKRRQTGLKTSQLDSKMRSDDLLPYMSLNHSFNYKKKRIAPIT